MDVSKMKKKNPIGLILVILFVFVLGGVGAYFIITMNPGLLQKEETNNGKETNSGKEEEKDDVESLDITSEEVQSLINKITTGATMCGNDYYKDKKITANDIPNDVAYSIAYIQVRSDKCKENSAICPKAGDTFTAKELEEKLSATFGKKYEFIHKEYDNCPEHSYDDATKTYTSKADTSCGGTCGPTDLSKVVKAEKSNNKIEIYMRVLFVDSNASSDNISYYEDYGQTKKVEGLELGVGGTAINNDINISKGSLYKLTFTEEDNNYVFTSSNLANE